MDLAVAPVICGHRPATSGHGAGGCVLDEGVPGPEVLCHLVGECATGLAASAAQAVEVQLVQDLAVGVEGLLELQRSILAIRLHRLRAVRSWQSLDDLVALVDVAGVEL